MDTALGSLRSLAWAIWQGKKLAKSPTNPFKGRQYPDAVIVTAVRWYRRYPLA